jgi:hypothetical protein
MSYDQEGANGNDFWLLVDLSEHLVVQIKRATDTGGSHNSTLLFEKQNKTGLQ